MFCKKDFHRNCTKFTGKYLCQSVFFDKVAGLRAATLLKKEALALVFSCKLCQVCKNTFSYTTPLLAATALVLNLLMTLPGSSIFSIKLWESLSNLLVVVLKQTSLVFFRSLCINFQPLLGKVSKQFLYKYQYSCILIFSVIWLGTIRLKQK